MTVPVRFDFDSITDSVVEACKADVHTLYAQNCVKDGILKYQTKDVLFSKDSPVWASHWAVLRETFVHSVFGNAIKDGEVKAWCFASFPKIRNLQWQWHQHPNAEYSAVMYLSLPEDAHKNSCFTTEFLQPDGKSLFVEPKIGSWFVFPGTATHRNGFWDYENMSEPRYCIAASVLKQK